jgi:hypothetical protein
VKAERLRSDYLSRWGFDLTLPFCRLLCEERSLGPVAPHDPEEALDGWSTWCGMFPAFHPIAEDDHAVYGLYRPEADQPGAPVVLRYDVALCHLHPVARGLAGLGAWAAYAALLDEDPDEAATVVQDLGAAGLEMPQGWPPPASADACAMDDAERAATGCGAGALLRIAWRRHAAADRAGALCAAEDACREAPWFVDAWYAAACLAPSMERRMEALRTALRQPAALSTRIEGYDLGPDRPEGHVLVACITDYRALAPPSNDGDPLHAIISTGRGLSSGARIEAAERFVELGSDADAEREMFAAVAVATSEQEAAAALQALAALYKRQRRDGEAAWCTMLADTE